MNMAVDNKGLKHRKQNIFRAKTTLKLKALSFEKVWDRCRTKTLIKLGIKTVFNGPKMLGYDLVMIVEAIFPWPRMRGFSQARCLQIRMRMLMSPCHGWVTGHGRMYQPGLILIHDLKAMCPPSSHLEAKCLWFPAVQVLLCVKFLCLSIYLI